MNGKAIGETIEDVASSISNSKWAKSIIPSVNELNKTIASNSKLSSSLIQENVQKNIASALNYNLKMSSEEANNISKKINIKSFEADIDKLELDENTSNTLKRVTKNIIEKEQKNVDVESMSIPDKIMKYPQAYFKNPDKKIRNTRIGTTVGAYTALSVGGRYLQGGTLTTDQYGRKDIAGIPFL